MKSQIVFNGQYLTAILVSFLSTFWSVPSSLADETISNSSDNRPNVLFIMVDDMSPHFSCHGETLIATPHVDRLAREGTLFRHAFATSSVCSACRSAMVTGIYQTSLGAHHHRSGRGKEKIHLPANVRLLPELFREQGYYTCIGDGLDPANKNPVGRTAGGPTKTDYNFEWDAKIYDGRDWSGRAPRQPFFMQVQLPGGKMRGGTEKSVQQLFDRARKEFGAATDPGRVALPPYYQRDPVLLNDWAAYLDSVRFTDKYVGEVIARLEQEGILEQTLIVFTTDHGISHARGKQFLYDEGTHVPLIVRGPGVPKGVRDDLIESIDVGPIALGKAGIPIPETMHGRDVFAEGYQKREAVVAARDRCDETVDRIRSVRTERYLYIRNFFPNRPLLQPNLYKDGKAVVQKLRELQAQGQLESRSSQVLFSPTRPSEELYEWKTDRWQIKNLAEDANHKEGLSEMRNRLEQWIKDTKDQGLEPARMYDSDMEVYLNDQAKGSLKDLEENIRVMKQWSAEGK